MDLLDDPATLATVAATLPRPLLVGLDVDGVLAPIAAHADDATLLTGIAELVTELAAVTPVAVVSGRSIDDLARFSFPATIDVIGSHGMEWRGEPAIELDRSERATMAALGVLAEDAMAQAGAGSWVERKPAAVVLHVRRAAADSSAAAVAELLRRSAEVPGAHAKTGHGVVELLARLTSKASAIDALRSRRGASGVVYVGDDRTDEEVFAALGDRDCSVRVGPGPTVARHRLAAPDDVMVFLRELQHTLR